MIKSTYTPTPVDVSAVALPESLKPLQEAIAKQVHDVWAQGRIKDGWRYGEMRDDETKRHPCLVPYGELDEREKQYDRATAEATIKLLIALGYKITR